MYASYIVHHHVMAVTEMTDYLSFRLLYVLGRFDMYAQTCVGRLGGSLVDANYQETDHLLILNADRLGAEAANETSR